MIRIYLLCFAFLVTDASAFAAEVIGIAKPGKKSRVNSDPEEPARESYSNTSEEEAQMQQKKSARKRRRAPEEDQTEPSNDSERHWGFSASLGLGFRSFSGSATISHYINRYVGLDLTGFYRTRSWEDYKDTEYGPELDLVLRLPNPTMITPFIGAGPGWVKWQRVEKDINFDTRASFTANYFVGANLKMTSFLVFQVAYRWINYLNDPPLKFEDHKKPEERTKNDLSIGLAVVI